MWLLKNVEYAFKSNLTEIGESQRKVVENYIKKAHKCFRFVCHLLYNLPGMESQKFVLKFF